MDWRKKFGGTPAFRDTQFNKLRSFMYVQCIAALGERTHSSTLRQWMDYVNWWKAICSTACVTVTNDVCIERYIFSTLSECVQRPDQLSFCLPTVMLLTVDKKNQLDVTFWILYFHSTSCSTCFGQPCAHHQELTTAWCYILVLLCAVTAGKVVKSGW